MSIALKRVGQSKAKRRRRTDAGKTRAARSADRADFARVCQLAGQLPGVEESMSYGTPALKVKGRFMCRLRTEAEGALALVCDFMDRKRLLRTHPRVFFITNDYRSFPMVLVRLRKVRRSMMRRIIQRAWRQVAPPKLVAEFDAQQK
jgi:hypothetical protein